MENENFRLILAIGLSMAVFLVWSHFTQPKRTPTPDAAPQEIAAQAATLEEPAALPAMQPSIEAAPVIEQPLRQPRSIIVETPLYSAEFSEKGASLISFSLTRYKESMQAGSDNKNVIQLPEGMGTLLSTFQNGSLGNLEAAVFEAEDPRDFITIDEDGEILSFITTGPGGVVFEKIFSFDPETYVLGMTINVVNNSVQPVTDRLALTLNNSVPTDKKSRIVFSGPCALVDKSYEEVKISAKKPEKSYDGEFAWTGITWRYFMSALVFDEPVQGAWRTTYNSEGDVVTARFLQPSITIAPGASYSARQKSYFGPKKTEELKAANLGRALSFGWFSFIAKPCLWLMNWVYNYIPNYGVAIILITILIKILLWPLGNKSYRSMNQMKKLQPMMEEIREKYKDDRQRMNQEIFALYKTFKVNPMGGCLPMLLQIPVFFGFYRMLYAAIELRHTPFFGWITDLSAPDRLFEFSFAVPFMHEPYGVPVLTIIMGATMLIQQKMSPPPGDPVQAKMMMALPIVFTFIFINFPSGLVLYWLVNNLASMAQQYYIIKTSD